MDDFYQESTRESIQRWMRRRDASIDSYIANEIYLYVLFPRHVRSRSCHRYIYTTGLEILSMFYHRNSIERNSRFFRFSRIFQTGTKKSRKDEEERKGISLSLSALKNGCTRKGWTLSLAGFSTNLPAAFANNTFYGDERRKGRGVFASRDSNGGSRVIINTGSGEEKCQQAEKNFPLVEDQSVPRLASLVASERAISEGRGGGKRKARSSKRVFVETRTPCRPPSNLRPFRRKNNYRKTRWRFVILVFPHILQPTSQSGRALLFVREGSLSPPEWKELLEEFPRMRDFPLRAGWFHLERRKKKNRNWKDRRRKKTGKKVVVASRINFVHTFKTAFYDCVKHMYVS